MEEGNEALAVLIISGTASRADDRPAREITACQNPLSFAKGNTKSYGVNGKKSQS
jgi:hypothetical protein